MEISDEGVRVLISFGFVMGSIVVSLTVIGLNSIYKELYIECPQCYSTNSRRKLPFRKYECYFCGLKLINKR